MNKYNTLKEIIKKNGGFITRKDIDDKKIHSWFLTQYVKKEDLIKIAPGFYGIKEYAIDELYILQRRYKKYIYNSFTALYLNRLIDSIPENIYVSKPQNYHPTSYNINNLRIKGYNSNDIYLLGVTKVKTIYGNYVRCYDKERCICDLIKYRDKYDSETFIKGLRTYTREHINQIKLNNYAIKLKIEVEVAEVMELLLNDD